MMKQLSFLCLSVLFLGCGGYSTTAAQDQIDDETIPPEFAADRVVVAYSGSNPAVLDAQRDMYTGFDLHRKVIKRSCSPTEGVCHSQKEYTDMRTTASFLSLISARCNAAPKHWSTVFDRCEQVGDKVRFANTDVGQIEIGYVELIRGDYVDHGEEGTTPTGDSTGLHIYLREPVVIEGRDSFSDTAMFVRAFVDNGQTGELVYEQIQLRFWILDDGHHLMGEVPDFRRGAVEALLNVGVGQGDHNRNGIYDASQDVPIALLNPGKPMESYFVARMMGHMQNEPVPGTRMPLANQPPTVEEMLALVCFVEALPQDGSPSSLGWPIDYANCSFNGDGVAQPDDLALTGTGGAEWNASILPLLIANCGGCHSAPAAAGGLDLTEEGVYTKLLGLSSQQPGLRLVDPGSPDTSYLWMKLIGAPGISGQIMPTSGMLPTEELDAINEWITLGAFQD